MDGSSGWGRLREVYALHHLADLPVAEVASTLHEKAPLLTSADGGYTWTETPLPGTE